MSLAVHVFSCRLKVQSGIVEKMGKARKIKVSKGETKEQKISLPDQIEQEKTVKLKNRRKVRHRVDDEEEVSLRLNFRRVLISSSVKSNEFLVKNDV